MGRSVRWFAGIGLLAVLAGGCGDAQSPSGAVATDSQAAGAPVDPAELLVDPDKLPPHWPRPANLEPGQKIRVRIAPASPEKNGGRPPQVTEPAPGAPGSR
jgi:hypothetical protein